MKRFFVFTLIIVFIAGCATIQPQDTSTASQPSDTTIGDLDTTDKQNLPKAIQGDIFVERAIAGEVEDIVAINTVNNSPMTKETKLQQTLKKVGDNWSDWIIGFISGWIAGGEIWP